MVDPDKAQGQLVLVDKGITYEVWQMSGGSMRLDWNHQGAVALTFDGYGHVNFGPAMIRRWDAALRARANYSIFIDFWDMPTYDGSLRITMTDWLRKHRSAEPVHILVRSKLVAMGVAVGNLALGGMLTPHSQRASYDLLIKKQGLPVNPSMPK
jgi:hypothetical protein